MPKKFNAIFFTDISALTWHMKSLGPYRLASELRAAGFSVLVIDYFSKWLTLNKKINQLLDKIVSADTLFVAYSSTFFSTVNSISTKIDSFDQWYGEWRSDSKWPVHHTVIKQLNENIRKKNPKIKILYGGAQSSPVTDAIKFSGVDYVIQGMADNLIVEVANNLKQKIDIAVDEVVNGMKILRQKSHHVFDFRNTGTYYHESDHVLPGEVLPIETSRGCMFKCKFCAFELLGRNKNDLSYRKSPNILTRELQENWNNFGINKYTIVDDTFNETTEKLEAVQKSINDAGIKIEFSAYIRLDLIARYPEQIKILKRMGIQTAFLGIETLNQKAAKSIGKNSNIDDVKKTLHKISDEWGDDRRIFASFIAGLPFETEESVNEWMQWVYDNQQLIHGFKLNQLGLNAHSVSPSELSRNPEKFGYKLQDNGWINNMGMTSSQARILQQTWMQRAWTSHRLRLAGWEVLGMQNLGFDFQYLKQFSLDQLPWLEIGRSYIKKFSKYQKFILDTVS